MGQRMSRCVPLFALLALAAPEASGAQASDSLDTMYDADAVPSESVLEDRLQRAAGSSWTWQSSWSGASAGTGHHGLRLRLVSSRLEILVAGDHDPGERLKVAPVPRVMDHAVASARWTPAGFLSIIGGSFRRAFFHGLTAGDERFGAPWTDARGAARNGRGLRPWAGSGEDRYLRGLAMRVRSTTVAASAWVSGRGLDATVDSVGGRWSLGGRHVTVLEKSRRGAVWFTEYGLAMEWSPGILSAGLVLVKDRFSVPFCATRCDPPERYRKRLDAGSAWFAVRSANAEFSVEIAPRGGLTEVVATGRAAVRSAGSLQFVFRRIGDAPSPLLASPPTARKAPFAGETGLLASWRVRLARGIHLDVTSDQSTSGDLALGRRTSRMDQAARLTCSNRFWSGEMVIRRSRRTEPDPGSVLPVSSREAVDRLRIRARASLTDAIASTAFADASSRSAHALGMSVEWAAGGRWTVFAGTTEYHGATGGHPLVAWEPSAPLSNPLRSLHGSGRRTWFLVRLAGDRTRMTVSVGVDRRMPVTARETGRRSFDFSIAMNRLLRGQR